MHFITPYKLGVANIIANFSEKTNLIFNRNSL